MTAVEQWCNAHSPKMSMEGALPLVAGEGFRASSDRERQGFKVSFSPVSGPDACA